MDELKRCPTCGGDGHLAPDGEVCCHDCGTSALSAWIWNRRPIENELMAELASVQATLEDEREARKTERSRVIMETVPTTGVCPECGAMLVQDVCHANKYTSDPYCSKCNHGGKDDE